MKIVLFLLLSISAYGQYELRIEDSAWSDTLVFRETKGDGFLIGWDLQQTKWTKHTDVLSEGVKPILCNHIWVYEAVGIGITTCAVLHDACGCPSAWPDRKQICKNCGRHLRVRETCETIKDTRESYEEVVKRFK